MDIVGFFSADHFAAQAGIKVIEVRLGYARCSMTVDERHLNAANTVQGGAIFTLADFCAALAANSHGKVAVSSNADIHFIKGGVSGDTLYAEARERFLHKSTSVYQVEVHNQNGDLIALFETGLYRKEHPTPFDALTD